MTIFMYKMLLILSRESMVENRRVIYIFIHLMLCLQVSVMRFLSPKHVLYLPSNIHKIDPEYQLHSYALKIP
jgi:hypothetical protein